MQPYSCQEKLGGKFLETFSKVTLTTCFPPLNRKVH